LGDPRRQKKKYATPRFPWRTDILQQELKLLGQYGLRNKHELWRHETTLSNFRGIARSLVGRPAEERDKLKKLGVLHETGVLDNVLDLTIEDLLERRLQTFVFRKAMGKTIQQSRQLITHGHIAVGDHRITIPSYIVTKEDETRIAYAPRSPLANPGHPLRQTISVAATARPQPGEERPEEES
jgi:small subunit ribosomal protein S4